jgi:hypothetical protein
MTGRGKLVGGLIGLVSGDDGGLDGGLASSDDGRLVGGEAEKLVGWLVGEIIKGRVRGLVNGVVRSFGKRQGETNVRRECIDGKRECGRGIQGRGGEIEGAINEDVGVGQRDSVGLNEKLPRIGWRGRGMKDLGAIIDDTGGGGSVLGPFGPPAGVMISESVVRRVTEQEVTVIHAGKYKARLA